MHTIAELLDAASVKQARHRLPARQRARRSEEHTSELQSQSNLVCRLLLEKKKTRRTRSCADTLSFSLPTSFRCIDPPRHHCRSSDAMQNGITSSPRGTVMSYRQCTTLAQP